MLNKSEINEWLHNEILTVTFTKVSDGTQREMRCTLLQEFLPLEVKNTTRIKPENPDVVAVYDLDNHGWRSFRIDSIIEVKENG